MSTSAPPKSSDASASNPRVVSDAPGGPDPAATTDAAPPAFEWTAHPARERPWTALLVLLAIVVLPASLVGFTDSFAWTLFAAIVLLFSLHRFFFATYYEISAAGVTSRALPGKRRVLWTEVTGVAIGRSAAWISSARGNGWREARRGVLILYGRQRETVIAQLRRSVRPDLLRTADRA